MGKGAEFLEFEMGPLEISMNKLNITRKKSKLKKKYTKKDENDGKNDLIKHNTMIHKNLFNHFGNTNLSIPNSKETFLGSNDKTFLNHKNRRHFSNKKSNIYHGIISKSKSKKIWVIEC